MKKLWKSLGLAILVIALFLLFPMGIPFVMMALTRARTRANVKGGGVLKIREISPAASDTFLDLGYLEGTDIKDEHNVIEIQEEAGSLIDAQSGGRIAFLETVIQQSSIDEINLRRNAVGKYYEVYYKAVLSNGNVQELNAPVSKIVPGMQLGFKKATVRGIPVKIYFLASKAAMTRNPVAYNIAVDEPYVITENAAAQGVPADTAASVASTCL